MAQSLMVCLSITAGIIIRSSITMELERNGLVIIHPTMAQTSPTSSGNMTAPR